MYVLVLLQSKIKRLGRRSFIKDMPIELFRVLDNFFEYDDVTPQEFVIFLKMCLPYFSGLFCKAQSILRLSQKIKIKKRVYVSSNIPRYIYISRDHVHSMYDVIVKFRIMNIDYKDIILINDPDPDGIYLHVIYYTGNTGRFCSIQ
jgi:hypothetical protein